MDTNLLNQACFCMFSPFFPTAICKVCFFTGMSVTITFTVSIPKLCNFQTKMSKG